MTTLLLIRHGMTDAVGRRIVGWMPGVGLNDIGEHQAALLGRELRGMKLDAVISSPLERAALTALAIARPQGLEVEYREGLGEVRFGDWTGKTLAELEADERKKLEAAKGKLNAALSTIAKHHQKRIEELLGRLQDKH